MWTNTHSQQNYCSRMINAFPLGTFWWGGKRVGGEVERRQQKENKWFVVRSRFLQSERFAGVYCQRKNEMKTFIISRTMKTETLLRITYCRKIHSCHIKIPEKTCPWIAHSSFRFIYQSNVNNINNNLCHSHTNN